MLKIENQMDSVMEKEELYPEMNFFKYISDPLKEVLTELDLNYIDKLSTSLKNYFRFYYSWERKNIGYIFM